MHGYVRMFTERHPTDGFGSMFLLPYSSIYTHMQAIKQLQYYSIYPIGIVR